VDVSKIKDSNIKRSKIVLILLNFNLSPFFSFIWHPSDCLFFTSLYGGSYLSVSELGVAKTVMLRFLTSSNIKKVPFMAKKRIYCYMCNK